MLRPYQVDAIKEIRALYASGTKKVLLHLATGAGKCHGKGTPILMFDGSIKTVENIIVGDKIMGPDSKHREVLSLSRGRETMYKVNPVKGDSWVCNESHILSLVHTMRGEIRNVSIKDYLDWHNHDKHCFKLYRTGINFPEAEVFFEPYALGIYLAEGTKAAPQITNPDHEILDWMAAWADRHGLLVRDHEGRGCREYSFKSKKAGWFVNHCGQLMRHCTSKGSRWIPKEYLVNSRKIRLEVLAGLLDGDGYFNKGGYEIATQHIQLKNDILFLARSLGFAAFNSVKIVKGKEYQRIYISGDLVDIPCLVERKKPQERKQKKNVLRTGFKLEKLDIDDYYGFEITGDHLYLLGDFTVTHNTTVFCEILQAVHAKGNKAIIVVHGRKLVDQASKRLEQNGVDHGVMMANHWRCRPNLPIQVCSISTLHRRRETMKLPDAALLIIDEAHQSASASYKWLVNFYEGAHFLAVTATPNIARGLRHVADEVVYPISMRELIGQGFLVSAEYYCPSKPILGGVHIDKKTGDYKLDELGEVMQKASLYGDMIGSYRKFADGLPTLLFCVSVKHSKEVCASFNQAGIPAEHMDASTPDCERGPIIARLEEGLTKVVCNVGILTTGVDIPAVQCIMLARPTKSSVLYQQICGRGTRPYPGKTKFLILDFADCVAEHGFIENEAPCELDGVKEVEQRDMLVTCDVCSHIWNPKEQGDYICRGVMAGVVCGYDMRVKSEADAASQRKIEIDASYELKRVEAEKVVEEGEIYNHIVKLASAGICRGMKNPHSWVYFQIKNDPKYGPKVASKYYIFIKKIMKGLAHDSRRS